MCTPAVAYAVLALSTAGSFANARAGQRYQEDTFARNKEAADANALRQYAAIQERQMQEQARASEAVSRSAKEARAALGTARVAAAEAGVAGLSVEALMGDFERTELEYRRTVVRNQEFLDRQFKNQLESVRYGQEAQILQSLPGPTPNYFGILLNSIGSALQIQQGFPDPYAGTDTGGG